MKRYFNIFALIIMGILFSFSGCDKKKDVTGVTIIPNRCVLRVGEIKELTAIVYPDDADDKSVKWGVKALHPIDTSKGLQVATVENGKVYGNSEGFALVTCITNNMFYETSALVMVGYAVAVKGMYYGSLSKNGEVINTAATIGIHTPSEENALFGLPFLSTTDDCPITVSKSKENENKMYFEGKDSISLQDVMTLVQVKGHVTLDGLGSFEILSGNDPVTTYTFSGTIIIGEESRPFRVIKQF